ncbi:biotin--[acetyl-CoA-carboxylase] ligase [Deinococcus petrolearius]|uniref:biotin--[biotin carboxyl-carrier protein] ligase n=1 Tax=Deinococcus petrolearius TaxID=1751295 RepID=A0ABW1DI95_9DEIO
MPHRLLPLLSAQPQSGEALGARLGVNRVTVSALAHRLQEDGVPLRISRAGYALDPGTPVRALVRVRGDFGRAMRYAGTVVSTQDEARAWADDPHAPAPHGAVCVAERQTGGRGRRGRAWDTRSGVLVFSVLLRRELSLAELALAPLAAGVALHAAATRGAPELALGLKWPNDLLSGDGRKVAGILLEAELRGEAARRAVLGIGVNVSAAPPGAAHLGEWRPGLTRAELLGDVLAALEHGLAQPPGAVLDAWRAASLTLGRAVTVATPRGPVTGVAEDLDASGSLLVRSAPGILHTVSAGDVQLVGALTPSLSSSQGAPP